MSVSGSNFKLSKWYLDCINSEGEAIIIYAAKITYNKLVIPYNSVIYSFNGNKFFHKSRFRKLSFPEITSSKIIFKDKKHEIYGQWESETPGISQEIFKSENGIAHWNCHHPKANAVVEFNNTSRINGLGYVEHISLTIEPWNIPMRQLKWGRFISSEAYIVWIEMKNDPLQQWLWYNGKLLPNCTITNDAILINEKNAELVFSRKIIIESEKKVSNLVKSLVEFIPGLRKKMTSSFLYADETKWLSKGTLKCAGQTKSNGWVIHEFVNFE